MSRREHIVRPGAPPIVAPYDCDPGAGMKPHGLWYGVDGGWREWCEAEEPHWVEDCEVYTVDLQSARILTIDDVIGLDCLHDRYRVAGGMDGWRTDYIDWRRLAAEGWDGIEIAPYQWERRLEYTWYYGWDCASGVVWNASKIQLAPVPAMVPA